MATAFPKGSGSIERSRSSGARVEAFAVNFVCRVGDWAGSGGATDRLLDGLIPAGDADASTAAVSGLLVSDSVISAKESGGFAAGFTASVRSGVDKSAGDRCRLLPETLGGVDSAGPVA
ncbi:MAG: hypothetical protein HC873_07215 [Leptolyngbyaceae cyanobacterium SL_1_1]|nr:hypothetical protein [Leptolyngbyaceae cyanobacterium SL_1_1]